MTNLLVYTLRKSRILVAGAVALSALAAPALAAQCAPKEEIAKSLASNYHEKPVGMGVSSSSGALTVIYASPAGTWTAIAITPNGSACVLDVGDGWTDTLSPGVTAQAD